MCASRPTRTAVLPPVRLTAGRARVPTDIFWEWAFWGVSVPVALFGFQAATGSWPDFSSSDDMAKLGAEAFAFVNVARFAVPLRIGLALGTTPWVKENVVDRFARRATRWVAQTTSFHGFGDR